MWLKRSQFIAIHEFWERMAPEQSGQLFDQRVADPSIPKEHLPGNEVRIAVMDIPRSTMELQRELEITVGSVGQLDSAAAAADACKSLGDLGSNVAAFNSPAFAGFGEAFRPGAAQGTQGGQLLPPPPSAPPPAGSVLPEKAFRRRRLSAKPRTALGQLSVAQGWAARPADSHVWTASTATTQPSRA